jgi:nucleoside-diphosphate-sugar epimerase
MNKRATAFVTEPHGFIGQALVKLLVARGHQVFALTGSTDAAERVRRLGAVAVLGDLRTPGRWQDEATTDWVFHLAPLSVDSGCVVGSRLSDPARTQVDVDRHLLDAVDSVAQRVVYVAHTSSIGIATPRPVTETEISAAFRTSVLAPALARLEEYALAGLPIVTALVGCTYGNGSWCRDLVVEPVMRARRVLRFGTLGPLVSTVHVQDCARALVHLAQDGEQDRRYFIVNNEPIRLNDVATMFAALVNRPLRAWRLPLAASRLMAGPSLGGYLRFDAAFSNIRLRGTGFRFEYPTLADGLRQVFRDFTREHDT